MISLFKTVCTIVGAFFLISWGLGKAYPDFRPLDSIKGLIEVPSEQAIEKLEKLGEQLPDSKLKDKLFALIPSKDSEEEAKEKSRHQANPLRGKNYHMSAIDPNSSKFGRVLQKVREVPGSSTLSTQDFLKELQNGKVYPVVMDSNSNRCSNCRGFKKVLKGTDGLSLNQTKRMAKNRSARSSPKRSPG